ncbi:PilW family protein [Pokkaliibacter sp. CJK22405]|uniref:PilW family protein n=1 Tax=Pokkaliibacter sp. CJK22405 TaxID=3384615 RepID=UPI00398560D7
MRTPVARGPGRYRQRGLSLIELMIALALGTVLVLAATNVMMSGRSTYSTITATSDIQDAARFSLRTMETQVSHAGFTSDPIQALAKEFPASTTTFSDSSYTWLAGEVAAGVGNNNASQELLLRMKGHGGSSTDELTDCLGQVIPGTDVVATQRFYIKNNALYCDVSYDDGSNTYSSDMLVDNVRYMRFRFAIDANADDAVDNWVRPSDLAAASNYRTAVTGVRVGIVVASSVNDRTAQNLTFQLVDYTDVANQVTYNQTQNLMQKFESTYWLANIALMKEE